jgi:hypothetical protein
MDNSNKEIRISGRTLRVARLDAELYHYLSDPEPLLERLRGSKERVDIFTFLQGLPETEPKFKHPMEWDNLAVVPISTFEKWWTKQISGKTRNMVKQAEKKGIEIREIPFDENLVRGIWEIYNETPIRQGRRFPHYGKDLDTVYRDEATYLDSSTFVGAFQGEELIGFIKLVTDEAGNQAGLMNILSKISHRDKAPTNALIAQAVKCLCRSRDRLSGLRQFLVSEQAARHSARVQRAERVSASRRSALLCAAYTFWLDSAALGIPS